MARRHVGARHPASRRRAHQRGDDQRVLVGAAPAGRANVRLFDARPDRRPARAPRVRDRAGHRHRRNPRVDGARLPAGHAHGRRRHASGVRREAQFLPHLARLPALRPRARLARGRALRRHAGPRGVACEQRVRQRRRLLLLRPVRAGVPRLARTQVRVGRGAQPRVVHELLEPHDPRLERDCAARHLRRRDRHRQMRDLGPAGRLPTLPERADARLLPPRTRRDSRARRAHAGHDEPDGRVQGPRLLQLGPRDGCGELGQLPGHGHRAELHRHVPRPDAWRWWRQAVHAHGADAEPAELVPVLQGQEAGRSGQALMAGGGARRRHRAVFPAQAVDRRLRALPRRGDRARRLRALAHLP